MKAEPGLVQFVKELPREQLERKFLLRKMQDQQRKQGYDAKVKAWLERPEQAELVQSLKATISPEMKPERQAQMLVNQAKNYIRNTGIKNRLTAHDENTISKTDKHHEIFYSYLGAARRSNYRRR